MGHEDLIRFELGSLEENLGPDFESIAKEIASGQSSGSGLTLGIARINSYTFYAYPGPEVSVNGRAEHLPYHFHVHCSQNSGKKEELRIRTEDFEELDGMPVPKFLRKEFRDEQLREELREKTQRVYHEGRV